MHTVWPREDRKAWERMGKINKYDSDDDGGGDNNDNNDIHQEEEDDEWTNKSKI